MSHPAATDSPGARPTRTWLYLHVETVDGERVLANTSPVDVVTLEVSSYVTLFNYLTEGDALVTSRPYYSVGDLPSGASVVLERVDLNEDGAVVWEADRVTWADGVEEAGVVLGRASGVGSELAAWARRDAAIGAVRRARTESAVAAERRLDRVPEKTHTDESRWLRRGWWDDGSCEAPALELERTPCYGTCPVYRVAVFADGRVEWDGQDFVAVVGRAGGRVDPEAVTALVRRFRRSRFRALVRYYGGEPPDDAAYAMDMPSAVLTFRVDERRRQFRDDEGRTGWDGERTVRGLARAVDRLAGTAAWIGDADLFHNS